MTLVYIISSQSLFTTINLLFLLLILMTKIISKYYIKNVENLRNDKEKNSKTINGEILFNEKNN